MIPLLSLVGCLTTVHFPPDLWGGDSGNRRRPMDTGADSGASSATPAPSPVVTGLGWGCDPEGTAWAWDLVTNGWTGQSHLDLVGGDLPPETHSLLVVDSHPSGDWDALRVGPLLDSVPPQDQMPNVNTRFDCGAPEGVSFAVRIRGTDGVLSECLVGGADHEAATAAARTVDPEVASLGRCTVWTSTTTSQGT